MKRISFFSTVFALIMMVMPAIALEIDLSGRYIVEHFSNSNETLSVKDFRNSYTSMELMLKPILTINENIKLTAELTALQDHVWGTHTQPIFQQDNPLLPAINSANNIDWKAAYVTLRTGIGGFLIGRGVEKKWGTGLGDSTGSHGSNSKHKDGVLWVVPVGDYVSGLGWQHITEADKGCLVADADFDKTYLFSAYKKEHWHTGLLLARYDHKSFVVLEELRGFQKGYKEFQKSVNAYKRASAVFGFAYKVCDNLEKLGYFERYDRIDLLSKAKEDGYKSITRWELETAGSQITDLTGGVISIPDLNSLMVDADIAQALATSAGAMIKDGPERSTLALWVFDPYIIGEFGPFKVEAELLYGWGKIELTNPKFNNKSLNLIKTVDVKALAGTVGVWRNLGEVTIGTGATYVQGDNNSYGDGKFSAIGYLEPSIDFERGFLLNSDVSHIGLGFGGTDCEGINLGNLAGGPLTIAGTSGYKMFWIESNYVFSENLDIGILCVSASADRPPEDWGNKYGVECDLTVKWRIMTNLVFDGTIAYLDAGSFWKAGNYNKINDIKALHAKLTLEF